MCIHIILWFETVLVKVIGKKHFFFTRFLLEARG